ncbi:MAG: hypothetical protein JNK82_16080 [Myxococcaceae bacterium]|nr:hypothetical protein [Myxococcaceae bacterium]
MGFIRFLLWTSMCIGLGIFIASYEVDGKTPAQHFRTIWKSADFSKKTAAVSGPSETHTADDKAAVDRIVAKRASK